MKTELTGLDIGKYVHKHLGKVEITEACVYMQLLNPDSTSLFIEHDGDIKEVSKNCVLKA